MPSRFEEHFTQLWNPFARGGFGVLVAVSGGADSVALLRALAAQICPEKKSPGPIVAAHFNHQFRGDESEADQQFVLQLCESIGIPCRIGRAEPGNSPQEPSRDEDTARRRRYDFLQSTAEHLGLRYVATAHTADDQAETILHRVVRGTGLSGLSGMAPARPLGPAVSLIRPLLTVRRSELLAYLGRIGQPHRVDSSNANPAFTRNRIRHELLPRLADEVHPEAVDAICRLGRLAGEAQAVIAPLVEALARRCVVQESADEIRIATAPLADQPPYLVRELLVAVWRRCGWPLRAMGFAEWETLAGMARSPAAETGLATKRDLPGGIVAEVREQTLRLRARDGAK
jgi:tRNA(Ile)-lysidine synthase